MGFTWIPHVWDWFSKFKEIIVFGDYEKGKITLLDELSKRFRDKTKHIRFEDYQGCKDANEILMKYGKQAVVSAVENAVHIPIDRVVELANIEKVDIYSLPKLATGISELDKLLKGGLYFGQVDIIGGKRGDGKSTLAGQAITLFWKHTTKPTGVFIIHRMKHWKRKCTWIQYTGTKKLI